MSQRNDAIRYCIGAGKIVANIEEGKVISGLGGHEYSAFPNPHNGYLTISIPKRKRSGKRFSSSVCVHRVIAYAKLGDIALDKRYQVHHINGNRRDNRGANLEVILRGRHKRAHGAMNIRIADPTTGKLHAKFAERSDAIEYALWKFGTRDVVH